MTEYGGKDEVQRAEGIDPAILVRNEDKWSLMYASVPVLEDGSEPEGWREQFRT